MMLKVMGLRPGKGRAVSATCAPASEGCLHHILAAGVAHANVDDSAVVAPRLMHHARGGALDSGRQEAQIAEDPKEATGLRH